MKQNQTPNCNSNDHSSTEEDEEESWPISMDKPYFHCILSKSQVQDAYRMVLPVKIHRILPQATVPVVLNCRKRNWEMRYYGSDTDSNKRFDPGWKKFAMENRLKVGDGCVFQLEEYSAQRLEFKVQILNGDIPSELVSKHDGSSSDNPITIV
ncbi:hypothetical protein IFM89_020853 [Coptis chinensis]|uniref:TF-B3 domain-containing protein n=1 Tax=Coptis chinensis TaxID=261450 RepID=A0A835MD50_9MAGN|nr:hypothetical protein IFM89_020853 [Coptis chinensis]